MKVLLRVRQQPSSLSQNSSTTATNATTAPSPTTAPLSSSGPRPTSSTISAGITKTKSKLNTKESDICHSSNLQKKSTAPDVSCSSSSGGIIRTIASVTSNQAVKAVQPAVPLEALSQSLRPPNPILNESSLLLVEDTPATKNLNRNNNSSNRGVETRKKKASSAVFGDSASRTSIPPSDTTQSNCPINCQPNSYHLSVHQNHGAASDSCHLTTPIKPFTVKNHIAAAVTTDGINNGENSEDRFAEPKISSHKKYSTQDSFEFSLRKAPSKDLNLYSTSKSISTAASGENSKNSELDRKRKANRNIEIEAKLPSQVCTSNIATTTAAELTSSPTTSSQQYHNLEIKSHNGQRRRKMGHYHNSENVRETDYDIDEIDTTTSSSSSSFPSTQHLVRVHTNNMEGNSVIATPETRTMMTLETGTMTDYQYENPADDIEPGRAIQNNHNFASASSDNVRSLRSNIVNYKLPGSTASTNVDAAEEELEDVKGVDDEEVLFQAALKKRGLEMVEQEGDGNCLFRAVSLQIYGDSEVHMDVRRRCLDFMAKDEAHFSEFVVDEPFMEYILRKRQNGVHGNNPEIQAISELYNRPVEVFVPSNGATPINIFQAAYKTCDAPLRLSYHDGNHYNAVTDPLCPTAGLGLGLPGLEPGLADRMQMQKAVDESEDLHVDRLAKESHEMEIQNAIVESKRDSGKGFDMYYKQKAALMASDMEATDFELEQAALADSLQSHYNNEGGQKQPWNHSGHVQQQQQQQRSRDRRRHQGGQPTSTSSTWVSGASSTSASMRSRPHSSSTSPLVASMPSVASVATPSQEGTDIPAHLLNNSHGEDDEYPQIVQELVMNGFPLERVLKAYDLIGDNFDNLLAFLMSSSNGS